MRMEKVVLEVDKLKVVGVLHIVQKQNTPIVVTCHGMLSTKDSEKYLEIADILTKNGINVLRFDFRGCGESEGNFANSTVTARLRDLETILQYVHSMFKDVGLLGSSLGGTISILAASKFKFIKALITWAAPFFLKETLNSLRGVVSEGFIKDLENVDITGAAKEVSHILVIHGDQDEIVPVRDAHALFNLVKEPKELKIIRGGDHRFTDPEPRKIALNVSLRWLKQHLY